MQSFHRRTATNRSTRCNRFVFRLYPDKTFEWEFQWDAEWQAKVDGYNDEAERADPTYQRPKWHWEE